MRKQRQADSTHPERQLAIGLVWGHLNAYQHERAYDLAVGCLQLWPEDPWLRLMGDYAAAELMEPVDEERLRALRTPENGPWVDLVLRRLQYREPASATPAVAKAAAIGEAKP